MILSVPPDGSLSVLSFFRSLDCDSIVRLALQPPLCWTKVEREDGVPGIEFSGPADSRRHPAPALASGELLSLRNATVLLPLHLTDFV